MSTVCIAVVFLHKLKEIAALPSARYFLSEQSHISTSLLINLLNHGHVHPPHQHHWPPPMSLYLDWEHQFIAPVQDAVLQVWIISPNHPLYQYSSTKSHQLYWGSWKLHLHTHIHAYLCIYSHLLETCKPYICFSILMVYRHSCFGLILLGWKSCKVWYRVNQ